ncbi:TPA: hypothetical protein I8V59_001551 [Corynebacterium striatum]|nr:hypothetical protein [Corynebacterium striatum]
MTTSEQTIYKFAQHYIANPRIIRSTRGTNMTAINLGMYHLEISNSDDNPTIFCDVYHHYDHLGSFIEKDIERLHTQVDDTLTAHYEQRKQTA